MSEEAISTELIIKYQLEYRRNHTSWLIGTFMYLDRIPETDLTKKQLAQKKALIETLELTKESKIVAYKGNLVKRLDKTDSLMETSKLEEKVNWIDHFLRTYEPMELVPIQKDKLKMYEMGEDIYELLIEYLLEKKQEMDIIFLDVSERFNMKSDIEHWKSDKEEKGYRGELLLKEVVEKALRNFHDKYLDRIEWNNLEYGFETYVMQATSQKL